MEATGNDIEVVFCGTLEELMACGLEDGVLAAADSGVTL